MLSEFLGRVLDALMAIPGIRFIVGLVDARFQPIWALLLLAGTVYLLARASAYVSLWRAREVVRMDSVNASPPPRDRGNAPIPASTGAPQTESPPPSAGGKTMPERYARLLLFVSLGVAVVAFGAAGLLMRSTRASASNAGTTPAPAATDTAFRFEDAGWRMQGQDCIATLRVTALGRIPRHLSLFVSGSNGSVIGRADVDSPTLAKGALLDFRIPKVNCDNVQNWEVQGQFGAN